jgi:putative hemolysin
VSIYGWAMFAQLSTFLSAPEFRTAPTAAYTLPATADAGLEIPKAPRLLRTYIGVGATICSAPAWDREFGTIGFLTESDKTEVG